VGAKSWAQKKGEWGGSLIQKTSKKRYNSAPCEKKKQKRKRRRKRKEEGKVYICEIDEHNVQNGVQT